MTWRTATRLYVVLTVLLSLATAAQAYLFEAGSPMLAEEPVLATLILGALAVAYMGAAVHAAHRAGTPVF